MQQTIPLSLWSVKKGMKRNEIDEINIATSFERLTDERVNIIHVFQYFKDVTTNKDLFKPTLIITNENYEKERTTRLKGYLHSLTVRSKKNSSQDNDF